MARRVTVGAGSSGTVEDLTLLTNPNNEDLVLRNIRDRYQQGQVYTRVGSTAIVAVNPIKPIDSSSDVTSKNYVDWVKDTGSDKQAMPAHVFDLASSVFLHMLREQQDQSVIFL
jgi:chitin synthase